MLLERLDDLSNVLNLIFYLISLNQKKNPRGEIWFLITRTKAKRNSKIQLL